MIYDARLQANIAKTVPVGDKRGLRAVITPH